MISVPQKTFVNVRRQPVFLLNYRPREERKKWKVKRMLLDS